MTVGDYLALMGELAIGVAGFSGVVAALTRRSSGEWRRIDVIRLKMLLRASLSVAAWAVIPALLVSTGADGPGTWRAISAAWLVTNGFVVLPELRRARSEIVEDPQDTSRALFALATVGLTASFGLQLANAAVLATAWPHLATITWGFFVSLLLFLRLVTVSFESGRSAD